MHVLVFAPFAVSEYHFETDLEIAQRHLDEGDRVTVVACNAELPTCEANVEHTIGRCVRCIGRRLEGIGRLSPKPEVISLLRLSDADRAELQAVNVDGMGIEDLRRYSVDNFDVGWAVLSTLITHTQGSRLDFDAQRAHVRTALRSALAVYRSMQKLLEQMTIDRIYVFNGRFATMRAVVRAAQQRGIDCFVHERGSTFEKYSLFENHLPHEVDYYQDLIEQAWAGADPTLREAVGASFFADRIMGSLGNWVSFAGGQTAGAMPDGWQDGVNNVAVFTSSTDENDAVADSIAGNVYADQYAALDRIFESARDVPGLRFWVRIHPRAQQVPDPGADRLLAARLPNVVVIPPGSSVSTYAIMRRATRVVTFGSTTGIEAAFWGIPSILALRGFYDRLGSTYNPKTHDEMIALLSAPLSPNDKRGALMYGYFQKTFGIRFKHFRPMGLFGGSFKHSPIKPNLALRAAGWVLDHAGARPARDRLALELAERRLLRR